MDQEIKLSCFAILTTMTGTTHSLIYLLTNQARLYKQYIVDAQSARGRAPVHLSLLARIRNRNRELLSPA